MKRTSRSRLVIFTIFLITILGITAVFTDTALAEKSGVVRLTVINNSQFDFSLELYGPGEYSIYVPAKSDGKIIVDRNEYSYVMEACNYVKTGTLNMTIFQTIHVPACGGNAGAVRNKLHHIDVSKLFKPVRITIRNKTNEKIGLYLRTIENHYFLNIKANEITTAVVLKEPDVLYVYSYLACGELITGYWTPVVSPPFDLKCPTK